MRNTDQHVRDSSVVTDGFCDSPQLNKWLAAHLIDDLDIGPLDPFGPAGSHRFEDGFLGRPASGEMLDRRLALRAVGDFSRREDASDECVVVLLNHVRNAVALDDICSNSNDVIHVINYRRN